MSQAQRTLATTAVYLFLFNRAQQVLIALRANTGYQDGNWQVPAGHIDAGELPTQALIREAKEELGITLLTENLRLVHTGFRAKTDETGDRVDFFFMANRWTGEVTNKEPEKCTELRWVSMDALPKNTTPHVRTAIAYTTRGRPFSEFSVDDLRRTGMYSM